MNEEEKITISVNEEDVQNIINCYEKDIKYIKQLEQERDKYKSIVEKAIKHISNEFLCYDNESDEYIQGLKAIEILKELEEGEENV